MSAFTVVTEVFVEAANPIDAAKTARRMLSEVNLERTYDVFPMAGADVEVPGTSSPAPVGHIQVVLYCDEATATVVSED